MEKAAQPLDPQGVDPVRPPSAEEDGRWQALAFSNTFAALRHRNYRLFFAGQFVSLVGTWMQNIAQAWLVYQLTNSPFRLGVVGFATGIPVLVLSLWAGVVVDRVPKRRLLLITQTAMMVLAFLLAADTWLGTVRWWHVAILAFGLGVVTAFDAPTRQSFVVEMVGRKELMNAIALNSAMFNAARIVGPALAGVTLAAVGAKWCFFLNGLSFLAVLAGLATMNVPPYVGAASTGSLLAQMREGIDYIRSHEAVRVPILVVAVSNVFALGYTTLLPAFASDVLHTGAFGFGLMSTAIGVGALIGALIIASFGRVLRKGRLLTTGNLLFPSMVLVLAFSRSYPLTLVALFFAGIGFMTQNATANALVQTAVPDALRGRVMSVYMMVFQGFFPFGALIAGTVAEHYGIPAGAAFGGAIALLYSLYLLWRRPSLRALP